MKAYLEYPEKEIAAPGAETCKYKPAGSASPQSAVTEDKSAVKVFVEVKDILWCHQPGLARASSPLRKQFCRKVRALERWFEKAGNSSEVEPRKLGNNEL